MLDARHPGRISMAAAIAGAAGYVVITTSFGAADVQRLDRLAAATGQSCSATVRAALEYFIAHLNAGQPPPLDKPTRARRRRTVDQVRAGARGWTTPSYTLPAHHARLVHFLARRTDRQHSAAIRAALVVMERQLEQQPDRRAA